MAGTGRAPKHADERRNRTDPLRGEWVVLVPLDSPKPPRLPRRGAGRGHWSARTGHAWRAWWSDPASRIWSEADRELVLHLADVYEEWVREPRSSMAAEVRQLRDNLALTPKGRQDRRLKIVDKGQADVLELAAAKEQRDSSPRPRRDHSHIRAVDPKGT